MGGGGGTGFAVASGGVGVAAIPAGAAEGAVVGGAAGLGLAKAISPFLFSEGGSGFGNIRFLNKLNVKKSQVSVDLEKSGSGEWGVQVKIGEENRYLKELKDFEDLPKSIRNNRAVRQAVERAFRRLGEMNK